MNAAGGRVVSVVCIGSSISLTQIKERFQYASVQRTGSEGGGQKIFKNCKSYAFDIFCHMIFIGPKSNHALSGLVTLTGSLIH